MKSKFKIVRVVTIHECVPRFLENNLKRMSKDFDVCVIGQNVSRYRYEYPDIYWVDVDIQRKISIYSDIHALIALCKFFIVYKPHIVHSTMPKAGLLSAIAGFLCRVPVRVHTFTGQVWTNKRGLSRSLLYFSDRVVNFLNTVCLTDGPAQSAFLHENRITAKGKPLPVLLKGTLSGIDMNRFRLDVIDDRAEKLRKELMIDGSSFVFAFIARKTLVKGAIDILKTFSKVSKISPRAKLLFVGPDESDGELDALIDLHPDILNNVINIGVVSDHEVYLAISNVHCLPSYREGFSTVTLDAAALGLPTIGSNIPGLMDSIEDGISGVLFPAGDLDKLAQAMLLLMEDHELCKQMGQSAKQRVETYFTADQLYDALRNFYFEHLEIAGIRTKYE